MISHKEEWDAAECCRANYILYDKEEIDMKTKFKLISYCFVIMLITSCGKSEPPSAEIMNLPVGVMRNGQPVVSKQVTLRGFAYEGPSKWVKVNENTWTQEFEVHNSMLKRNVPFIDTYNIINGAVILSKHVCDGESIDNDQRIWRISPSLSTKITE